MVKWGKYLFSNYLIMSKDKLSQEQICVEAVNKAPEPEKKSVFEKACALVKNKTKVAALALSLWISWPALASTPAPQETQKVEQSQEIVIDGLNLNELPPEFKDNLVSIKNKFDAKSKEEKLNIPLRIEKTSWKEWDIVNDMSLAPKKTFKELTWSDTFTISIVNDKQEEIDTYSPTVKALYNMSDLRSWYRIWKEKRIPTDEELKDYVLKKVWYDKEAFDSLWLKYDEKEAKEYHEWILNWIYEVPERDKWLWKIQDWIQLYSEWKIDAAVTDDAEKLFNEWIKNLKLNPSREAYRRLFIDSFTLAFLKNLKVKQLDNEMIKDGSNQVWEYLQFVDNNSQVLKIWFWDTEVDKVYLFPSKESINKNLWNYKFFENFWTDSLKIFNSEASWTIDLLLSKIRLKSSEEELAKEEQLLAKSQEWLAREKELSKFLVDFKKIQDKNFLLLSELQNSTDEKLVKELDENMKKLKEYKVIFENNLKDVTKKDVYDWYNTMLRWISIMEEKYNELQKKLG